MKKLNSLTELKQRIKMNWRRISLLMLFFANISYAQVPELFEEKILINNMAAPWGFTFINSDEVLFTEKQGKVFHFTISTETLKEISGVPSVSQTGQGGLLDIALHPDFSNNNYVYLTYAVAATGGQTTALGRGKLVGNELQNFTELFRALPIRNSGQHFGSRIVFDNNNFLYMSVGDRGVQDSAQSTSNHFGKVLRFNDDGTVPSSNPLVGVANAKPEIYTWGNRNIQGMAMNPATGEIYAHEHGPRGGDELNLIKANTNYGWPAVTFGINYNGTPITPDTTLPGMELPLTYWVPSIAPSGMTFIRNGQPNNEADILIGALAGTHIHWLKLKDNKRISSTRSMNGYARFRDVRQAPDGKIYAMTESPNRFVLLRSSVPLSNSIDYANTELEEKNMLYPNPSNGESTLSFYVSTNQLVSVRIFSSNGSLIKTYPSELFPKGKHALSIESENFPPGIYHVEINKGGFSSFLKFIKM
jgi:aldose sugar dehydrogenase